MAANGCFVVIGPKIQGTQRRIQPMHLNGILHLRPLLSVVRLVAGAFSAVGMGEAGAGAAVIVRTREAGFSAGSGPPAGSVLRRFTHFRAA